MAVAQRSRAWLKRHVRRPFIAVVLGVLAAGTLPVLASPLAAPAAADPGGRRHRLLAERGKLLAANRAEARAAVIRGVLRRERKERGWSLHEAGRSEGNLEPRSRWRRAGRMLAAVVLVSLTGVLGGAAGVLAAESAGASEDAGTPSGTSHPESSVDPSEAPPSYPEDPTGPADADPTDPSDPAEPSDPEPGDPADPTDPDPDEPTDPSDPTDPVDPTDPDPDEPTDPGDPVDPTDPDPADPVDPGGSTDPGGPSGPTEPVPPTRPAPAAPSSPGDPSKLVAPSSLPDGAGGAPGVGVGSPPPVSALPETNPTWLSPGSTRLPVGTPGASWPQAGRVPAVTWDAVADVLGLSERFPVHWLGWLGWVRELAERSLPPRELPDHGEGAFRSIAFPVLGPVTYTDGWGDCRDGCQRAHVGTDIVGVRMQPLLAVTDGTVVRLRDESVGPAGVILTIEDDDGWRYSYFHNNNDTPGTDDGGADPGWRNVPGLAVGDRVRAGQVVGYMGDSGNAEGTVPHLHFEFRDPAGVPQPSYWSLRAAEARQACTIGLGPWSFPHLPREKLEGVASTVVTPMFGEGEWLIDTQGRVTATGDAALIIPSRDLDCAPGPTESFGTDAAGWTHLQDPNLDDARQSATFTLDGVHGLLSPTDVIDFS